MPELRPIRIDTPLGDDLYVQRMTGTEELGRLYSYSVLLVGEDENLAFEDLLGHDVTVTLELPEGGERYFHGFVTDLTYVGRSRTHCQYRATVRPYLWFLTRTSDCRIFQQMTVPDIVEQVLDDHGFTDIDNRLSGTYREWEYCVQYRETAFNFISRLLEQEGAYYYFQHEEGKHTLVLCDSPSAHETVDGYDRVSYTPPSRATDVEEGRILAWEFSESVLTGACVMTDFDPLNPSSNLEVRVAGSRSHEKSDMPVFDYPGEYVTAAEGETYVEARMQEIDSRFHVAQGMGRARGMASGALFTLRDYPLDSQNLEYLVTSARYTLVNPERESGRTSQEPAFEMTFTAIPGDQRFAAARTTPKPSVPGPQTAFVTGPSGEEIWTDEHGRVKVQFHWDRVGAEDENTTCWLRVSEAWAGGQWGTQFLPRIGHEVIVDFLEGDPDRPLVTGRVYNAQNVPPYALPDNKTQSGILSRSTKEGSSPNANEIRFEDKVGEELVHLQGEKDFNSEVENDQTIHVMNDRTRDVDNDETVQIGGNRTESVGVDETITIGGNRTESVTGDESITVGGSRTETISGSETRSITGSVNETVNGAQTETITGVLDITATGGITINTPATVTIMATGGITVIAPGGTTTADDHWFKTGALNKGTTGTKMERVGTKVDLVLGVAQAYTASKNEMCGTKIEAVGSEKVDEATEAVTFGQFFEAVAAVTKSNGATSR